MAEDLPAPKSRKEEYLATAAGMTGIELPEPASREEIYLDAIAQGGGGGGSSYTAGDGIDITSDVISVDTETIQPKLTAGTNITIDENNVISAGGGSSVNVVQTTGTSTTDVMSQNAISTVLFDDPAGRTKVKIGDRSYSLGSHSVAIGHWSKAMSSNAVAIGGGSDYTYAAYAQGTGGVAIGGGAHINSASGGLVKNYNTVIGYNATAGVADSNVAIGAYSKATEKGQFDISTLATTNTYGYNNSQYRLLTGVYDGQSAHDAATYGQVISYSAINGAGAPTTATEGKYVGQLYYDTTNEAMYFLKSIDTTVTPATYTWESLGGGSSVNVVQATGQSTTDVMSQKAVTDMIFNEGQKGKIQIGAGASVAGTGTGIAIGVDASTPQSYGDIAIGDAASSTGSRGTAIGWNANVNKANGVALGRQATAAGDNSVAVGWNAYASEKGQFDISTGRNVTAGYNNTNYRVLSGVHDPRVAHDAATKGYVDTKLGSLTLVSLTQSAYDALATKDPNTLYIITGA